MAAASSHELHGGRPVPPGPGNFVLRWVHIGQEGAGFYQREWVPSQPANDGGGLAGAMSDGHSDDDDSDLPRSVSDSDDSESGNPVSGQKQGMIGY